MFTGCVTLVAQWFWPVTGEFQEIYLSQGNAISVDHQIMEKWSYLSASLLRSHNVHSEKCQTYRTDISATSFLHRKTAQTLARFLLNQAEIALNCKPEIASTTQNCLAQLNLTEIPPVSDYQGPFSIWLGWYLIYKKKNDASVKVLAVWSFENFRGQNPSQGQWNPWQMNGMEPMGTGVTNDVFNQSDVFFPLHPFLSLQTENH